MHASTTERENQCFLLGAPEIQKLWVLLEEHVAPPIITAKCQDGVTRYFKEINEFTKFDNVQSHCLRNIEIKASNKGKSAIITFDERRRPTFQIRLEGPEDTIIYVLTQLERMKEGYRPWYSSVASFNFGDFIIWAVRLIVFGLIVCFFTLLLITETEDFWSIIVTIFKKLIISILGATSIVFIIYGLFDHLRRKIFPLGVFTIGAGQNRHETMEKVRWSVVIGLLVSLAAGIVLLIL